MANQPPTLRDLLDYRSDCLIASVKPRSQNIQVVRTLGASGLMQQSSVSVERGAELL
jgi:hypothetical protein